MVQKLSFLEAVALGVGTMIGASIFSIFGYGVKIAGAGLPVAFLISGIYALMVGYSYAKFGQVVVSNAGPIAFVEKGLGRSPLTGSLGVLMWLSYVVSISLFAVSFAGYFLPLLGLPNEKTLQTAVEVGIIALFGAINYAGGSKAVGRLEFFIVLTKLAILLVFIAVGMQKFRPEIFLQGGLSLNNGILTASVVFFLSYMGFGIITNDSENIENPKKNVPRAIFTSILIVIFIYTMVSVSALSLLPVKELIMYKENALAKAVEPVLGKFGFLLVSLGALVSISSALNAALYSGANAAYAFMRNGYIPLPNLQRDRIWMSGHAGLYLTCALALVFAIAFNVTSIASIISLITTIIYIFVLFSHLKLAKVIGGKNWLVFFNLIVVSFVAINIMKFQMESNPAVFFVSILLFLVSYLAEKLYYGKLKAPPA